MHDIWLTAYIISMRFRDRTYGPPSAFLDVVCPAYPAMRRDQQSVGRHDQKMKKRQARPAATAMMKNGSGIPTGDLW